VKGVTYNPTPIGMGFDYDLFSYPSKPWLIDGKLMKDLGVNCVRVYSCGRDIEKLKEFVRDMYNNFGIYTIVGDWLGLWNECGPNYSDKNFRESIKKQVLEVVEKLKDEKGILMWVLGNENNYTCMGNISFWTSKEIEEIDDPAEKVMRKAEIYYSFVNEIAEAIKAVDKKHLVALGNGEVLLLDKAANYCKSVDVLAIIAYRGKKFGTLFSYIKSNFDKPVVISEFGADSFDSYKEEENEDIQAEYIVSQWEDLYRNTTFSGNSKGNCIGGVIFEWTDEWWKHNEGYQPDWWVQNKEAGWSNGSYYFDIKAENNLNMNEEWFGIVKISQDKEFGINKRIPKKAYFSIKDIWRK
ncbi:MAG: hypothetical protein NC820_06865, partial [Candidatus Omnitrophica bacterium]|nr:hypothetical protein [Candidatus Omnitrophota bacterium]